MDSEQLERADQLGLRILSLRPQRKGFSSPAVLIPADAALFLLSG